MIMLLPILQQVSTNLRGPDRKPLATVGVIEASVSKGAVKTKSHFYMLEQATPLLCKETSVALGIVAFISSVDDYPELFSGLGEMPVPYTITLREDAKPYAVSAPCRVPLPLMDKVKEELNRLESLEVIKRVTEPSDW